MRVAFSYILVLGLGLAAVQPVAAQSPLEGPLAAPDAAPAAPAKPTKAKPSHKKAVKTAHQAQPKPNAPGYDPATTPQANPVAQTGKGLPDDPMSFGMKWNGSNDDARETRVQNYNGNAAGTGAEVGMKLHF